MVATPTVNIYGNIPYQGLTNPSKSKVNQSYGLNFPLGSQSNNYFAKSSNVEFVKNQVKQVLLTTKGERLMLPNFGCNLKKYLFQPLDEKTFEEIKEEVTSSFYNYVVGASIKKIKVFVTDDINIAGGNALKVILVLTLNNDQSKMFDVGVVIS